MLWLIVQAALVRSEDQNGNRKEKTRGIYHGERYAEIKRLIRR